jgi:hypothetical protein
MAAITFNATHRRAHLREQLTAARSAFREALDTFVSDRMRRAAAEAEHVRPRQPEYRIAIDKRPMIAVQLMSPELSRHVPSHSPAVEQERTHPGGSPADKPSTVVAQFQPLDPGIVSDAIPAFFIGRNKEGFWVARDANGQIGGIFLLETSALSFAKRNSRPAGCATIYPSGTIELDLENKGNPLVEQLGLLARLSASARQRMAALVGGMTEAVRRQLRGFLR